MDYKDVYIRLSSGSLRQLSDYQMRLTEVDAPLCGNVKEPYKVTWYDEHGDDEYIPSRLLLEAFELKLGCVILVDEVGVSSYVGALVSDLLTGSPVVVYDDNSGRGWCNARFMGIEDAKIQSVDTYDTLLDTDGVQTVATFTLKFKVNSPLSTIQVTRNGSRITAINYTTP